MKTMKPHPIAGNLPPMPPDQLVEMATDIKTNGLFDPITTFEGMILDGNTRLEACKIAGVEPVFQEFSEQFKGKNPKAFVASKNLRRRMIPKALSAEIGAKLVTFKWGGDRTKASPEAMTQAQAAKAVGVSRSTLQRAARKTGGAKKKSVSGWTVEEVKEDQPLWDALMKISKEYGKNDTKAIREGTIGLSKSDIIVLSQLPVAKMRAIQDLIMAKHWSPQKSLKFIAKKPDVKSTASHMLNWALGTENKIWKAKIGGGTFTVEIN